MEGLLTSSSPSTYMEERESWREVIERQVENLKFGTVNITVHEGRVVQMEASLKIRFDRARTV